jgi:hypothetical protein
VRVQRFAPHLLRTCAGLACWLACAGGLVGCERVLALDPVTRSPDASSPDAADAVAPGPCTMPLISDTFTESLPCSPWGTVTVTNGATASEGNMALTFQLPMSGTEGRCDTTIAMPYGGVEVRVGALPDGAQSYMSLESQNALHVELAMYNGALNLSAAGGNPVYASEPFDAAAMRYWRFVPVASSMTVAGEYSADGVTWTELPKTAPLATLPDTIDLRIKAGIPAITAAASATQASFTYLLACP